MSADVFGDTSGLAHLAHPAEPLHVPAHQIYRAVRARGGRLVTTNYVLAELVALLHSPLRVARPRALELMQFLRESPPIEIVHITPELDEAAWQLLQTRPDKEWSLVDCASFALMQARNLQESLTTDHHFEQADFSRLLR